MLVQISTEEIREMEREEAWQPTKGVPVIDEDILEVHHNFFAGCVSVLAYVCE